MGIDEVGDDGMKVTMMPTASPYKYQPVNPRPNPQIKKGNYIDTLKSIYGDKRLKAIGLIECATCASRTYQDVSDDPGVSFKSPGHISPEASASVVMAHEQEHVTNERASAQAEGGQVVAQSVSLVNGICPECGRVYVAGGTTRTISKTPSPYKLPSSLLKGASFDQKI